MPGSSLAIFHLNSIVSSSVLRRAAKGEAHTLDTPAAGQEVGGWESSGRKQIW